LIAPDGGTPSSGRGHVRVTNISLSRAGSAVDIRFDVSWQDSWRYLDGRRGSNWDAAWIFIKYRVSAQRMVPDAPEIRAVRSPADARLDKPPRWEHARVAAVRSAPEGAVIDLPEDGLGVFIRRSEALAGAGPVSFEGVELRCDLVGADFTGHLSIWIVGIEMVYIPEGPFHLGDPEGPSGPFACFYDPGKPASDRDRTYRVASEDPIEIGPSGGGSRLSYDGGTAIGNPGDGRGPVPRAFPKGYGAFYLMKYQITQGQYGDFINMLRGQAKTVRFSYWYSDYRYTIFMTQSGRRVTLRPTRACNWLSWTDGVAYACWAGLRPMSELEFEKACRGPLPAVAGEYAWGTTRILQAQVLFGEDAVTGNCSYGNIAFLGGDGGSGPLAGHAFGALGAHRPHDLVPEGRAFFSLDGESVTVPEIDLRDRIGASYYGVMGLSGNLWEWCVTVGEEEGRRFGGEHGTGALDDYGNADTHALGWPGIDVRGACVRGGSWYTTAQQVRLADRSYGSGLAGYSARAHDFGYRCARTAPATCSSR
jgi:formylglycine-generating enzyme required for sulfatase activity